MDKKTEHGIKVAIGAVGYIGTLVAASAIFVGAIPILHGPHYVAHFTKDVLKEIEDWTEK